MSRKRILSSSPYEETVGFCRALRVGNLIYVSGTAPISPDGTTACVGDAYGQATRCFEIIVKAIKEAGGTVDDIVRTRMYVTSADYIDDVTRAHSEFLAQVRPTATLVIINKLVRADMLVEIEADAVIDS